MTPPWHPFDWRKGVRCLQGPFKRLWLVKPKYLHNPSSEDSRITLTTFTKFCLELQDRNSSTEHNDTAHQVRSAHWHGTTNARASSASCSCAKQWQQRGARIRATSSVPHTVKHRKQCRNAGRTHKQFNTTKVRKENNNKASTVIKKERKWVVLFFSHFFSSLQMHWPCFSQYPKNALAEY